MNDTSDISDWEWIAGGFPCRDMISERLISDDRTFREPTTSPIDRQTPQTNIISEISDEQPQTVDPSKCPISIVPGGLNTTMLTNSPLQRRQKPRMLQRIKGRKWRETIR